MTLSNQNREENMAEALKLLLERLGDRAIYVEFLNDDPAFTGVYPTTWKDLEDSHLVSSRPGPSWCWYHLTGEGWLEALQFTGALDTVEFQDRFGRLNATLISFTDNRHEKGFKQIHVVAEKAGVTEDWLSNILESRIWENKYNRHGAEFDDSKTSVIIPTRFNMPRL